MHRILLIVMFSVAPVVLFAQKRVFLSASMMLTGKVIYNQRCITCHQADGMGAQNMIPPLINTDYVLGDKKRLIQILLNGLSGEMKVNGDIYSNEMPGHSDLKDTEIAAVLTYVRNSFGNKASAVIVPEVKKIRAANKKQ
jgi:mono/diheme cytochrome c family protein